MNRPLLLIALLAIVCLTMSSKEGYAQLLQDRNKLKSEKGPRKNFSNNKIKEPSKKTKRIKAERVATKYSMPNDGKNKNYNVKLKANRPESQWKPDNKVYIVEPKYSREAT